MPLRKLLPSRSFTKLFKKHTLDKLIHEVQIVEEDECCFVVKIDSHLIYVHKYGELKDPKAVCLYIHGVGGSGERLPNFVKSISKNNVILYSIDLPGHGRSEPKGVFNYNLSVKAIYAAKYILRERYPNVPLIFITHSMGSSIIFYYAAKLRESVCAIALSPPFRLVRKKDIYLNLKLLYYTFKTLLFPNQYVRLDELIDRIDLKLPEGLNTYALASPLYKVSSAISLIAGVLETSRYLKNIPKNSCIILVHGTRDEICDVRGTIDAYEKLKENLKYVSLKLLPGCDHNFNGFDDEKFLSVISKSLDEILRLCT